PSPPEAEPSGPRTWSRKNRPVTRLPISRPWRSVKATTTVSMVPSSTSRARVATSIRPEARSDMVADGTTPTASVPGPATPPPVGRLLGRGVRRGDTAVDQQRLAGHEAGLVGGQEEGALGDLGRFAEPPHRDVHQPPLPLGV